MTHRVIRRITQRGFALLTALWLITALGLIAGLVLATAQMGAQATHNRILLTRAGWAREACHEMLLSRYATDHIVRHIDTVALGQGTWCYVTLEDEGTKLDLNRLSDEALRSVLGDDTLVDALLDWRDSDDLTRPLGAERAWYEAHAARRPRNGPLAAVAELRYVRGFDSAKVEALERVLMTDGSGQLDLNAAPLDLLLAIPGMTREAVEIVRSSRLIGRSVNSTEALLERLSPSARRVLLDHYQEFSHSVVFEPARFVELAEGGVKGFRITSRGWLTVVPTAGRLAVIRREIE